MHFGRCFLLKRWYCILLLIVAGSLCVATVGVRASAQQRMLSEKMIRFHVLANSDTDADQTLKLQVRDAALSYLELFNWQSRAEAETWLNNHIAEIENVCRTKLAEFGCSQTVSVTLENEVYPTRKYDTFSLPAGEYLSLKIVLGQGGGHNWWCVVYPSFCTPTPVEFSNIAVSAGFLESEITLITDDSPGVEVKFKILELLNFSKKK